MIYLIITFIIIILAYLEGINKSNKFSQYAALGIVIVMILFAGLRDKVGTDWDAYYNAYQNPNENIGFEIGYTLLNGIFGNLHIPYNCFLLFINGLSLILMYFFVKKNSIFMVIGLLVFFSDLFLYFNLSGIRQAVAMSITCYSITFALQKQFLRFVLLVLVAACFHMTAVIFLLAYFIPKGKISKIYLLALPALFFIGFYFLEPITEWITVNTLKDATFYVQLQEKADSIVQLYYVGVAKRAVIILAILLFGRKLLTDSNSRYFFNLYVFGFIFFVCTYLISPDIGVRLSSYFTIFDIVLAGNLICFVNSIKVRVAIVSIFAFIAVYKIVGYMNNDFYTYKSIFNIF
jgi:hypothetical protein